MTKKNIQHCVILLLLLQLHLTNPLPTKHKKKEITIPIELYNSDFEKTNKQPRYVVGSIGISKVFQTLCTFDLGNHAETIINLNECRGCYVVINSTSVGCPDLAPICDNNNDNSTNACWASDPKSPLPNWTYYYTLENCTNETIYSGNIHTNGYYYHNSEYTYKNLSVPTCTQCFGSGSHSRFYTSARTIFQFSFHKHAYLPSNFSFGALLRTVPQIDRIWSNVGIGYHSSFLQQLNVSAFIFSHRAIILHPKFYRYKSAPYLHYPIVKHHRKFKIHSFQIGKRRVFCNRTILFNMDSVSCEIACWFNSFSHLYVCRVMKG